MVEHEDIGDGCLPLHTLCRNSMLNEQSAIEIMKLLVTKYPESLRKKVGEQMQEKWWMISLDGTLGKLAIDLAEKQMSFGFCKALLSEYAHISVIP